MVFFALFRTRSSSVESSKMSSGSSGVVNAMVSAGAELALAVVGLMLALP
jgi:hypothetical protein